MEPSIIPVTSLQTGVTYEERSFQWRILNFPDVLQQKSLINSQQFEFHAGGSIGMSSKWAAYLVTDEKNEDGVTWVEFFIGMREGPKPAEPSEHLHVKFTLTFKNKDGIVNKELVSPLFDWYEKKKPKSQTDYGFPKLFDMKGALPSYMELVEGSSLVFHISFKLYTVIKGTPPLETKLGEFGVKSIAKARVDLAELVVGNPVASESVRVIAKDKVEFRMQKDILSARSPVFRVMLEADMTEGNAGVIEISDMGSTALKTMLHFMFRGELLPDWKEGEVLPELTNAAAKYQLSDLLTFLDGVLGTACNLDNVGALILLANRLALKRAEEDLLCFLRRNGADSAHNFLQVFNGMLALESSSGEASSVLSPGSLQPSGSRDRLGKRNVEEEGNENRSKLKLKRSAPKNTRGKVRK